MDDKAGSKNFSIVVPTFHEAKNISELIKRIAQVDFGPCLFEVLLMDDDSQDGTEEIVRSLQPCYPWLRLIVRKGKKGLSDSVLDGFKQAKYPLWVVLDADLSHPPEKIPQMLSLLAQPEVEMVIGSRYVKGGSSDEKWPLLRKVSSYLAAWGAKSLVGGSVKDPLSGFLALKSATLDSGEKLEPIGWKIGLEIMVKCRCKHVREVPIHFATRTHGTSKLNFKVVINYLQHIKRLMWFKIFSA